MQEVGLHDYTTTIWNAVLVPAGTPHPIVQRLAQAFSTAANDPAIQHHLARLGVQPLSLGPKDASRRMQHAIRTWASVIKAAGIKLR